MRPNAHPAEVGGDRRVAGHLQFGFPLLVDLDGLALAGDIRPVVLVLAHVVCLVERRPGSLPLVP